MSEKNPIDKIKEELIVRKAWSNKPSKKDMISYIQTYDEEEILDVLKFEKSKADRAKADLDECIKRMGLLLTGLKIKHNFKDVKEVYDYLGSKGIKL